MARVVVVDDSKAFRSQLKEILIAAGYEVVAEAENGQTGFEQCKHHQPDIVTLDIGMPVVDGIAALKMIQAELPAVKVIMISAESAIDKVRETLTLGASYYILKPCDARHIITVINEILTGNKQTSVPL